MPCLPIIEEEVADFEQSFQIQLPAYYKEKLADVGMRAIYLHRNVGMLDPNSTMAQFALFTKQLRARFPKFPQDGVVIDCSFDLEQGVDRFLLPDANDRTTLGNIVYAWDKENNRKIRDCSLSEWLDLSINCAPEELLLEHGIEKKVIEQKPLFRVQGCPEPLKSMLGPRGDEAGDACPIPVGWIFYTTINIKGRYLVPCDFGQVPETTGTPAIKVSPGQYRVEVRLAQSCRGDRLVIGAVRVVQDCAPVLTLVKKFDVDIDVAAVTIYDRQSFFKRVALDDRDDFCLDMMMDVAETPCVVITGATNILVIPSGHGDGTYPVYQLASDGVSYGMEIHFIAADDAPPV